MMRFLIPGLFLLLTLVPDHALSQATVRPAAEWNSPRALEMISRARDRRSAANADSGLISYRSDARIFVYFYLDRPDTGERNLVKTDQLALEVYWQAPDLVKQRIIGWRDEKSLPTNIHYHLDHLTVVQENFGDEIRLGDGDEVINVVHPAAPNAPNVYDFQLSDSLTLRLPGTADPVRVYEIRVRPKNLTRPGFVGSIFVERDRGDIVRMDFTFTRSSYVDRYLDYINISLDNGLWQGRFWLPNQQRVEIRRRIPELDIPAGSVIRANMRISNYHFDDPLPRSFFAGEPVVALPRAQREAFPFEADIHSEVREEGIGPQAELGEIRRLASELLREQARQRSSEFRFRIARASDLFRYNRAEGVAVGAGAGFEPVPGLQVGLRGGWALGASHPLASLSLSGPPAATSVRGRLYVNEPRDMGIGPVASGALNTLSSLFAGRDYLDPYYVAGVSLDLRHQLSPRWALTLGGFAERQRSAALDSDFSFFGSLRPVRAIDPTDRLLGGRLMVERPVLSEASNWWASRLRIEAGALEPRTGSPADTLGLSPRYILPQAELSWGRRWTRNDAKLDVAGAVGMAVGELPVQKLYLLGGRGTMPGYPFRGFGGDRFALVRGTFSADLARPWVRGRLVGAVGWAGVGEAGEGAAARVGVVPTRTLRPSIGAGVGLLHGILHLDLTRGLGPDGEWEFILEANPSFWDFL